MWPHHQGTCEVSVPMTNPGLKQVSLGAQAPIARTICGLYGKCLLPGQAVKQGCRALASAPHSHAPRLQHGAVAMQSHCTP